MGETSHIGASVDAEGLVDLFLAVDGELVQGAGAAGDQAVVDETQVVNEVTLALLLALSCALACLLYTSPSPRDRTRSRMPSSA